MNYQYERDILHFEKNIFNFKIPCSEEITYAYWLTIINHHKHNCKDDK